MTENPTATASTGTATTARDVLIIGAGPTGLFLANLLGGFDLAVTVVEKDTSLIDYPRGVSMDDETLRILQGVGLVEKALEFVVPNQRIDYMSASGKRLGGYAPTRDDFGWPAKSGFIQPAIDQILLEGLDRFPNVDVLLGREVRRLEESEDLVDVEISEPDRQASVLTAKYVVGCDGGRSATRKHLGVAMEGTSESRRWLVMDLRNDPIGQPNVTVLCDPKRPVVSIGLPQGLRRFEFMLFDNELDEDLDWEAARRLAAPFVPQLKDEDIIRKRVYTHHSLVAESFRKGRILLAGDAAHLMPVWQGQGYNTGVRDAANLAWKLALVTKLNADDKVLETYDKERRPHAAGMVNLSRITGMYLGMTNRTSAFLRNTITLAGSAVPSVRDYFMQMKFKPMPRYSDGAVVTEPGPSESPVGTLFIQPRVLVTADGGPQLLDDVVGSGFAILRWGSDPCNSLSAENRQLWEEIGTRFITVLPMNQWTSADPLQTDKDDSIIVGDVTGSLRRWFDANPYSMVFVRPDRIIASACQPQVANERSRDLFRRFGLAPLNS